MAPVRAVNAVVLECEISLNFGHNERYVNICSRLIERVPTRLLTLVRPAGGPRHKSVDRAPRALAGCACATAAATQPCPRSRRLPRPALSAYGHADHPAGAGRLLRRRDLLLDVEGEIEPGKRTVQS